MMLLLLCDFNKLYFIKDCGRYIVVNSKESIIMIDTPVITKKEGNEPFITKGEKTKMNLLDFWSWSSSDLINNAQRGVLAEFIVTRALEVESNYRMEWNAYDIITSSGFKIEVKSAAYIQSWKQEKISNIVFGIKKTKGWNAITNDYSKERKRQSDIYIFCLLKEKDANKVDPLDLDQWKFYVIETYKLDEKLGGQKTISLKSLLALKPICIKYEGLKAIVADIEKEINKTGC